MAPLGDHRRVLRAAFGARSGVEVDTQGDAFFFAFADAARRSPRRREASDALADRPISVRIGLHTGEPRSSPARATSGLDVHRAAQDRRLPAMAARSVVSAATSRRVDWLTGATSASTG